jgi:hypothetical protein
MDNIYFYFVDKGEWWIVTAYFTPNYILTLQVTSKFQPTRVVSKAKMKAKTKTKAKTTKKNKKAATSPNFFLFRTF